MNLLGLLLLSLTISLSTSSCGEKDEKKDGDTKESNENNSSNNLEKKEDKEKPIEAKKQAVKEEVKEEVNSKSASNWPQGLINGCEQMMLDEMNSDPMPDEVRAMLTDFPTYEEIASCVCETMASNYPTLSDLSELENIDESALGMQMIDCMGEDFKKLMQMGGEM